MALVPRSDSVAPFVKLAGGSKPQTGNGTPTLGSQTQCPSTTGPLVQVMPHGAGGRLTLAHECAHAAVVPRPMNAAVAAVTNPAFPSMRTSRVRVPAAWPGPHAGRITRP